MAETKKTTKTENVEKEVKTQSGFTYLTELIFIYLVPLVGFIFSFLDSSKYSKRSKFLYNQAGAAFIISFSLTLLALIPFVGFVFAIVDLVLLAFLIVAIVKGAKGEDYKIPGIYDLGNAIWGKKNKKKEEK